MEIRQALENEHSRTNAIAIADRAIGNADDLASLMNCFFDDDLRMCQRAAWSVGFVGIKQPELLHPYLRKILDALDNPKHDAVVRNVLRTFEGMNLPEEYEGEILERCFSYITSPKYAVAIRAFAITVASKIAIKYPEIKDELIQELQYQQQYAEKAAIKSRLKRHLKELL